MRLISPGCTTTSTSSGFLGTCFWLPLSAACAARAAACLAISRRCSRATARFLQAHRHVILSITHCRTFHDRDPDVVSLTCRSVLVILPDEGQSHVAPCATASNVSRIAGSDGNHRSSANQCSLHSVIMLCGARTFASKAVQQRVGPSCSASPEVHVDESERNDGHHNCRYI